MLNPPLSAASQVSSPIAAAAFSGACGISCVASLSCWPRPTKLAICRLDRHGEPSRRVMKLS